MQYPVDNTYNISIKKHRPGLNKLQTDSHYKGSTLKNPRKEQIMFPFPNCMTEYSTNLGIVYFINKEGIKTPI